MNGFTGFILGVLVGWLGEWVIDWFYWRGRAPDTQDEALQMRERVQAAEALSAELQQKLADQVKAAESRYASLESQHSSQLGPLQARAAELEEQIAAQAREAETRYAALARQQEARMQEAGTPSDELEQENARLRAEIEELRLRLTATEGELQAATNSLLASEEVEQELETVEMARSGPSILVEPPAQEMMLPAQETELPEETIEPSSVPAPEFVAPEPIVAEAPPAEPEPHQPDVLPRRDNLVAINGVGPVIARKLNEGGVFTFRQVAELTPDRLRELVGETIARVADEDAIIADALRLADLHDQKM